jgi:hypothetical protein
MAIWQSQDGALHDDGEGAALSLSSWPQGMTQLTDDQLAGIHAATSAAQALAELQSSAQAALDKTSITVERIVEGVSHGTCGFTNPDVVAFMSYRKALRDIVSGKDTASTALPTPAPYPSGT